MLFIPSIERACRGRHSVVQAALAHAAVGVLPIAVAGHAGGDALGGCRCALLALPLRNLLGRGGALALGTRLGSSCRGGRWGGCRRAGGPRGLALRHHCCRRGGGGAALDGDHAGLGPGLLLLARLLLLAGGGTGCGAGCLAGGARRLGLGGGERRGQGHNGVSGRAQAREGSSLATSLTQQMARCLVWQSCTSKHAGPQPAANCLSNHHSWPSHTKIHTCWGLQLRRRCTWWGWRWRRR